MKTYRSPRELLAEIECILAANEPSFRHSPLQDVVELLCQGRHYTWMGIYLAVGKNAPQQLLDGGRDSHPGRMEMPETRTKILVSMKLGGREAGVLDVENDRGNAFGAEDRVLLENVAARLARFLAGPGKYLARKARGVQPAAKPGKSAAAGEK